MVPVFAIPDITDYRVSDMTPYPYRYDTGTVDYIPSITDMRADVEVDGLLSR